MTTAQSRRRAIGCSNPSADQGALCHRMRLSADARRHPVGLETGCLSERSIRRSYEVVVINISNSFNVRAILLDSGLEEGAGYLFGCGVGVGLSDWWWQMFVSGASSVTLIAHCCVFHCGIFSNPFSSRHTLLTKMRVV